MNIFDPIHDLIARDRIDAVREDRKEFFPIEEERELLARYWYRKRWDAFLFWLSGGKEGRPDDGYVSASQRFIEIWRKSHGQELEAAGYVVDEEVRREIGEKRWASISESEKAQFKLYWWEQERNREKRERELERQFSESGPPTPSEPPNAGPAGSGSATASASDAMSSAEAPLPGAESD